MKLRLIYVLFGLLAYCILFMGNSIGRAEVGFGNTGAPGDMAGCFVTSCHVDTEAFGNTTIIQVFEPGTENEVTAYQPDSIYDMRVTLQTTSPPGGYGFQIVCIKDSDEDDWQGFTNPGTDVQIMIASSTMRQYAEHNKRSLTDTFNFQWVAPAEGVGDLTFYASGNAVDGNMFFTNDDPDTTFLKLPEALPLGIQRPTQLEANIVVYPNPVSSYLNAIVESELSGKFEIEIFDLLGRQRLQQSHSFTGLETRVEIDVSLFGTGFYALRVTQNGESLTAPFFIE